MEGIGYTTSIGRPSARVSSKPGGEPAGGSTGRGISATSTKFVFTYAIQQAFMFTVQNAFSLGYRCEEECFLFFGLFTGEVVATLIRIPHAPRRGEVFGWFGWFGSLGGGRRMIGSALFPGRDELFARFSRGWSRLVPSTFSGVE